MDRHLNLALSLAGDSGFYVFPVKHGDDNTKTPLTPHGHKDASRDPNVIMDWWGKFPEAKVGVACGKSGIIVADIDTKNGVDGWGSLDEAWLDLGEPYSYETGTGGSHLVYRAPDGLNLAPHVNYRGMAGVDVRAGESWVLWAGGVPAREVLNEAPQWLLDESKPRTIEAFDGTIQEWYANLIPGEPNVMVRRAIDRIEPDMGHSDMVSATYEAIRLGAEGATGVPELIDALEEAWMNRPVENHTTPESAWEFKFQEALLGGIEKYGDSINLLKDLPEYSIILVPKGIPDSLITTPGGKAEFSRLLGELVKETEDDNRILSILWNAPATRDLARDWGLQFTAKRIEDARVRPEPTRENPRIEEKRAAESEGKDTDLNLLTDEERAYLKTRPTFVDHVVGVAEGEGYDQFNYFRAIGWNMLSMSLGLRGAVPVSGTHSHKLNLWQIIPGWSGTGKSVAFNMLQSVLKTVMHDNREVPYDLGADSSIQGLHTSLLQRDGLPSQFATDEASGWFKKLKAGDGWMIGVEDALANWFMGNVPPSSKVRLQELRGKSATTSFNLFMLATPDMLLETLDRGQFKTGFLARMLWTFGEPREITSDSFDLFNDSFEEAVEVLELPKPLRNLSADLVTIRASFAKPVMVKPTPETRKKFKGVYEKVHYSLVGHKDWDIIEPALTRHMESMLKAAALCAMYRGDTVIEEEDALHAILAVENWLKNLVRVAEQVGDGDFQKRCAEAEAYIRQLGGSATATKIYHRFGNWITRDAKEIDNVLTYLTQAGIVNRDDKNGGVRYELNGAD